MHIFVYCSTYLASPAASFGRVFHKNEKESFRIIKSVYSGDYIDRVKLLTH